MATSGLLHSPLSPEPLIQSIDMLLKASAEFDRDCNYASTKDEKQYRYIA
jgi:hypothetical protein